MIPPPPTSTLFPYTTLFRSSGATVTAFDSPAVIRSMRFKRTFCVVARMRSEEHTSELQSRGHLVCRLLLEKKKKQEETSQLLMLDNHADSVRCVRLALYVSM